MKPNTKKLFGHLIINTILLVALYFIVVHLNFPYISMIYTVAGAGLGLGYVIYNRGFSGKDVTPEMLPDSMPYDEKIAFIEDSRARMDRSRWVLTLLIPILLTLCLDMIYIFILPLFGVGAA